MSSITDHFTTPQPARGRGRPKSKRKERTTAQVGTKCAAIEVARSEGRTAGYARAERAEEEFEIIRLPWRGQCGRAAAARALCACCAAGYAKDCTGQGAGKRALLPASPTKPRRPRRSRGRRRSRKSYCEAVLGRGGKATRSAFIFFYILSRIHNKK
jgi:hypothetical protein